MLHFDSNLLMQQEALKQRAMGKRIGFVPTMGFLHEGHISLIKEARKRCDWLVVSIFVNPLQFEPHEDLETYPRDLEGDAKKCKENGVDAIFIPQNFYTPNHLTYIRVENLTSNLCGASRPKHFEGVTTVVTRLFGIVQPQVAVFGEKDFQQLAIIRRLVDDLAMPIEIVGCPLIRDEDGLALSSRNKHLNQSERERARTISKALQTIKDFIENSQSPVKTNELRRIARDVLKTDELDYLEFVDPTSLQPLKIIDQPVRAMIAAWVGTTRLIDNIQISVKL